MNIRKNYNYLLAILSLLNGYSFIFFRSLSLAMIVTGVFSVVAICIAIQRHSGISFFHPLIFFIFGFTLTLVSVATIETINAPSMIYVTLKILIWSMFLSFSGSLLFDKILYLQASSVVIKLTFIYLLVQYVMHFIFHINVPNAFNFGLVVPHYEEYEWVITSASSEFRPGSLWLEPSWLGYYYSCFLCMCLFDEDADLYVHKDKNVMITICCIGCFLSMSSSAIGIAIILIALRLMMFNPRKFKYFVVPLIFVGCLVYLSIHFGWISSLYGINKNLDLTIYKLMHLNENGRTGVSYSIVGELNPINQIIGVGYGNEQLYANGRYLNGVVTIVLWNGYLGIIAWIVMFIQLIRRFANTISQRLILILFVLYGLFAGLYFGPMSFSFIFLGVFSRRKEKTIQSSNMPINWEERSFEN